ncbi:uncharacterized protein DFL_004301 [Arthrobotrys flagrans]|uniref:Uncharacterized protein n=1 Tax=Arthrobotrys flagrans TaxID=97331 RepID=A0A437A4F2_ARTFL|nr:hypothetical protein DFL_004301 [Arthrobotrys flagrans]
MPTSTVSTSHLFTNGTTTSAAVEGTTASPVISTATFTSITRFQNTTSAYSRNSTATTFSSATSTLASASMAPTSTLNFPKVIIKDAADSLFLNTNADGTIFLCNDFVYTIPTSYRIPLSLLLYEFQLKVVVVSSANPGVFLSPVACRIEGQPTKMFVVKELESGIETLKILGSCIAGGKVLECSVKNFDLLTA